MDIIPSFTFTNVIEYVTIATTGNATDFGDITVARRQGTTCSLTVMEVYQNEFNTKTNSRRSNKIQYRL